MEVLEVKNLGQSYGSLQVLEDVSFSLKSGEKVALIGPNGAGKTTLLNVLSGFITPLAGQVNFLGQNITKTPSYKRASLGLARSFQLNSLFPGLNLLSNVLLAVQGVQKTRYQLFRPMTSYSENLSKAKKLLDSVNLWEERESPITDLSYGQQRQVEIILALASNPKLLLMDEPSAGLSRSEGNNLIDMIGKLSEDTTVFFSAHDLDLVFSLADRVVVLYYGRILTQGAPDLIQSDPKVSEIYLGI